MKTKQVADEGALEEEGDNPSLMADKFVAQQRDLLMLIFKKNGEKEFKLMKRKDLHRTVREAAAELYASDLKVGELSGSLRLRDLQLIDPDFVSASEAALVVRRHCIVISAFSLHAIILHDRCFIQVPDGADSVLAILMASLRTTIKTLKHAESVFLDDWSTNDLNAHLQPEHSVKSPTRDDKSPHLHDPEIAFDSDEHDHHDGHDLYDIETDTKFLPFEFRAMEAVFLTMLNIMDQELLEVNKTVQEFLNFVKSKRPTQHVFAIDRLRTSKRELQVFKSRAEAIREAFAAILACDPDMAHMYLTSLAKDPSLWDRERRPGEVEDVECMLECYLQKVDSIITSATLLEHDFEHGEQHLELQLDRSQNALILASVVINTISMSLGISGLITGMFGMSEAGTWLHHEGKSFLGCVGATPVMMVVSGVLASVVYRAIGLFRPY